MNSIFLLIHNCSFSSMLQNSLEPLFLVHVHPAVDIDIPYIQRQAKDKPVRIEASHGVESGSWRPPVVLYINL